MKKRLTIIAAALMASSPLTAQHTAEIPEVIRVGEYEVYVLQESVNDGSTEILIDAPAEVLERYAPDGTFPMATNAVLVRRGDDIRLIDTGYGRTIIDRLASLGISPEDVDEGFITHLHGDHTGGLLRNGVKAFPNAMLSLSAKEFVSREIDGPDQATRNIFDEYSVNMLIPVEIGPDIPQGIAPVKAYGHTPGHTIYMISDCGDQLLIWGDLTHAMAVQMPHPEISVRYDKNPDEARDTRLEVLRYAANRIRVVGMHIPSTRAGHVKIFGDGYEFIVE